jgi:hypothetical protein
MQHHVSHLHYGFYGLYQCSTLFSLPRLVFRYPLLYYLLSSSSLTHLEVFLKVAARATISVGHFLYLPARMSRYLWFPCVSSSTVSRDDCPLP